MEICLSSHTLMSIIRLAATDGVVIVVVGISWIGGDEVDSNLRVEDDDE